MTLVEAGTIEGGNARMRLAHRLKPLFEGMVSLIEEYQPQSVAIEQLYSHYAHPQTAILMGHARGVLCLAAALGGIEVIDYPAKEVKASLTGNGGASKQQVQRAIRQTLHLDHEPEPADVSDALALAVCHAYRATRSPGATIS